MAVGKEDLEQMEEIVDVGHEIRTAAVVADYLPVSAAGHKPEQKQLHNLETVDPLAIQNSKRTINWIKISIKSSIYRHKYDKETDH